MNFVIHTVKGCGKGAKGKKLPAAGGVKKPHRYRPGTGSAGNMKVPKINSC